MRNFLGEIKVSLVAGVNDTENFEIIIPMNLHSRSLIYAACWNKIIRSQGRRASQCIVLCSIRFSVDWNINQKKTRLLNWHINKCQFNFSRLSCFPSLRITYFSKYIFYIFHFPYSFFLILGIQKIMSFFRAKYMNLSKYESSHFTIFFQRFNNL